MQVAAVLVAATARVSAAPPAEAPPASRRPVPVAMDLGRVAVGRWAEYQVTSAADPTATMRVALVAGPVPGRTLEVITEGVSLAGRKVIQTVLPARLSTAVRHAKTIVQIGAEAPIELTAAAAGMPIVILKMDAKRLVGSEKVTTGGGAFLTKHYRDTSADGDVLDVWVNDGVPPLGVVRVIGEQRGGQGASSWFEYELTATGRNARRQIAQRQITKPQTATPVRRSTSVPSDR